MSMLTRATRALPPRVPQPPTPPTPVTPPPIPPTQQTQQIQQSQQSQQSQQTQPVPPTQLFLSTGPADRSAAHPEAGAAPDPAPLGLAGGVVDLPSAAAPDPAAPGETTGQRPDAGTGTWPTVHDPGEAWLHVAMMVLSALAVLFGATALWLEGS